MFRLIYAIYPTPFGNLTVIATADDSVVRASGFTALDQTASTLPSRFHGLPLTEGEIPAAAAAVEAWLAGDGSLLTAVPAEQDGGPFLSAAWEALRTVPAGEVVSYAELAAMAGSPRAVRAAGTACAQNHLAPFVPCHRVVKTGGQLGNYGFGGSEAKAAMLALEGASPEVTGIHAA